MIIEKNKIVFSSILLCILLFIGAYTMIVLENDEQPTLDANQIPMPELGEEQEIYDSKLEALEAIKEERKITAPSVYPDHMVDEKGYFNPDYMEYEKHRIIDSIYQNDDRRFSEKRYENLGLEEKQPLVQVEVVVDTMETLEEKRLLISAKELALEHQLFFASKPMENDIHETKTTDEKIHVKVDGTQTVKKDYRLQLRLSKAATIDGRHYPRNTPLYGFISFKPNRTVIDIESINHQPLKLKAFDFQDGREGVYIENSFRAQATQELMDDITNDINIVGVPQVTGIKRLFQRNNRTVKVTIFDNYQLILKPTL